MQKTYFLQVRMRSVESPLLRTPYSTQRTYDHVVIVVEAGNEKKDEKGRQRS
jgi:hypothetical protein